MVFGGSKKKKYRETGMKKGLIITAVVLVFLLCSCVVDDNEDYFEAKLLGKWETYEAGSIYKGKLDISYRYIQ
jgi:hypothetical protein